MMELILSKDQLHVVLDGICHLITELKKQKTPGINVRWRLNEAERLRDHISRVLHDENE